MLEVAVIMINMTPISGWSVPAVEFDRFSPPVKPDWITSVRCNCLKRRFRLNSLNRLNSIFWDWFNNGYQQIQIDTVHCMIDWFYMELWSMFFCDYLKSRCKELRLKQTDIADRLDVKKQAVSKWFNGTSIPEIHRIPKLAEILQTDPFDLVAILWSVEPVSRKTVRKSGSINYSLNK